MKILCGLGNPGQKYAKNRHNAGFIFLDAYAKKNGFPEFQEKWNALVSEKGQGDEKILLVKPLSYMNLSGEVLVKFLNFYKTDPSDLFLIYDDVDLKLGTIRFKEEGSAGTHNGMRSVIEKLGFDKFPRLRLGIETRGSIAPEQMDISDFVLSDFSDEEMEVFLCEIDEGVEILEKKLA